jgi:hypothetical protein
MCHYQTEEERPRGLEAPCVHIGFNMISKATVSSRGVSVVSLRASSINPSSEVLLYVKPGPVDDAQMDLQI